MTAELTLDCRGLPEAIAVLRIKQALECHGETGLLTAQIDADCSVKRVRAGLGDAGAAIMVTKAH